MTNQSEPLVFCWDVDTTITGAPIALPAIARALKAAGHKNVVVTGHGPQRDREALLDQLDFPYDEIIVVDPKDDGSGKAKVLKKLGADFMFENQLAFAPAIAKVCPVTVLYTEPPGDKHAGKQAKKAAKNLKRSVTCEGGPADGKTVEIRDLASHLDIGGGTYRVQGDTAIYQG